MQSCSCSREELSETGVYSVPVGWKELEEEEKMHYYMYCQYRTVRKRPEK